MARPSPTRPGWYVSPDDPGALRYWDGGAWTGRSRPRPPWSSRADELEVEYGDVDRSVEGPVHPQAMREHAFSGVREWSLRGVARRSDQARRAPSGPWSRSSRPAGWQPPPKLGPARRPLLVVASMIVIAVVVVVSSVAVMAPYRAPGTVMDANSRALAEFAALASRECQATLPRYRAVLADDLDGPSVLAAADQVDLLRQRLSAVPIGRGIEGPVEEWLQTWQNFTTDQRRYASIVGPAVRSDGRLVPRSLPGPVRLAAVEAHSDAVHQAVLADKFSANLRLGPCRLEQSPPL
jgi:hypothetical protein